MNISVSSNQSGGACVIEKDSFAALRVTVILKRRGLLGFMWSSRIQRDGMLIDYSFYIKATQWS